MSGYSIVLGLESLSYKGFTVLRAAGPLHFVYHMPPSSEVTHVYAQCGVVQEDFWTGKRHANLPPHDKQR